MCCCVLHKGSRGAPHSCKKLKHAVGGGGEAAPGRSWKINIDAI